MFTLEKLCCYTANNRNRWIIQVLFDITSIFHHEKYVRQNYKAQHITWNSGRKIKIVFRVQNIQLLKINMRVFKFLKTETNSTFLTFKAQKSIFKYILLGSFHRANHYYII